VTLAFILFVLLWGLIVGGIVTRLFFGTGVSFFFAFLGAMLLVILYRRYVQHRPIWGPGARRPPA
jgi:positive regulator of sigma E activity